MKAVALTGIGQMGMTDIAKPVIENDNDVLLKVERVGVCGSDLHYYQTGRIGSLIVTFPFLIGHECSATVEALGSAVDRVKVGDQVAVDPAAPCYNCDQCKAGRENTCRNLRFLGTPGEGNGCLCEYIVMPQQCCFLPANGAVTLEQAVLCEPFAIGVYAVKRAQMPEDAKIAILGSGPIGLSCMAAARANQARVYMTDRLDYRTEIAANAGADWVGNPDKEDIGKPILQQQPLGIDAVFECAGQQETLDQAADLLKPGGKLVLIGSPRTERISFISDKMRRKEITVVNIRRQSNCTQTAIDLIAAGKVNIDFMITHKFKPEQTKSAFDMVAGYRDGVIKALIEF